MIIDFSLSTLKDPSGPAELRVILWEDKEKGKKKKPPFG